MKKSHIHTIDLDFMGIPGSIACYLIPHENGAVLVESGPGSTIPALQKGLQTHGLKINDITDVLLTHIHLDHAGAAGWLAKQGARIHVHHVGAPHMLNPEKLIASATRIYGDMMETLWGEFLPVPEYNLSVLFDNDVVEVGDLRFTALDTPGHANHHHVYLLDDVCFSGDIGGVRIGGFRHLRLPMPPPEFNLELWRESQSRLQKIYNQGGFKRIAPTHFGIYSDPDWHLEAIESALNEMESWIETVMPADPDIELLNEQFLDWTEQRTLSSGLDPGALIPFEAVAPSWMSSYGIQRYWRKVRSQK
jgi:glyoxylase-like metal-dependent hydrolase (beta-lactamase superfamily II)